VTDLDPIADSLEVSAKRLLAETSEEWVPGDDVARAVDLNPDDPDAYHAFRLIQKRGTLRLETWQGGMGLPQHVGS
jgi:hypothetical protein